MFSLTPLMTEWTLEADSLPERLLIRRQSPAFVLPGADALTDFSDLIGFDSEPEEEKEDAASRSATFSLPALFPPDVTGHASLSREIDFGSLCAQRVMLEIEHLCGSGNIMLDKDVLLAFSPDTTDIQLDLTDAMRLGRRRTLSLCFDDAKNAGVCGSVLLRATDTAHFEHVLFSPSFSGQTVTVEIAFFAAKPGFFAVRAACVPDAQNAQSPWREMQIQVHKPGIERISLTFSLCASFFSPGTPYSPPLLKLELHTLMGKEKKRSCLCDTLTRQTGTRVSAPRAYVPLTKEECRLDPDRLIAQAKAAHLPALFFPVAPSALACRRCTLEGVALMPYLPDGAQLCDEGVSSPCVYPISSPDMQALRTPPLVSTCTQLCAMLSSPHAASLSASDEELLWDTAGHRINIEQAQPVLQALRVLEITLRAEAFRQGQFSGALCAPGEWQNPDIFNALRTALEPLHLSVLPLRGAWWAQSRFSASLQAFIPKEEQAGVYTVRAQLLNHNKGEILTDFSADCPVTGGVVGVIDAILPDDACVLTLETELLRSGAVIQRSKLPVYVGLRGPLEAAFVEGNASPTF